MAAGGASPLRLKDESERLPLFAAPDGSPHRHGYAQAPPPAWAAAWATWPWPARFADAERGGGGGAPEPAGLAGLAPVVSAVRGCCLHGRLQLWLRPGGGQRPLGRHGQPAGLWAATLSDKAWCAAAVGATWRCGQRGCRACCRCALAANPRPAALSATARRWSGSALVGAAVGSMAGSGLADTLGRRRAFVLDALPLLAGAVLSATARRGLGGVIAGRGADGGGHRPLLRPGAAVHFGGAWAGGGCWRRCGMESRRPPLLFEDGSPAEEKAPPSTPPPGTRPWSTPPAAPADLADRAARHAGLPQSAHDLHRHPGRCGAPPRACRRTAARLFAAPPPCLPACLPSLTLLPAPVPAALLVNVALPATQWRTMFALGALPAALLGLGERRRGRGAAEWRCCSSCSCM